MEGITSCGADLLSILPVSPPVPAVSADRAAPPSSPLSPWYSCPGMAAVAAGRGLVDRRLDNGVRVLVLPTGPGSRLAPVALQLWVMAGASAERPPEHGCAHLLEHMLFKPGADRVEGTTVDIATAIEALGGDVNAYTSHDETVFHATVPACELDAALDGLVRPVVSPALDTSELESEAQVVVEEIKQYHDDPAQRAAEELVQRLYDQHSYGRPVLGTEEDVLGHTDARLRAFHRRLYAGCRTVLVVAGPVDADHVVRRAHELLGGLPRGRGARSEAGVEALDRFRVGIRREDVHEAHVMFAWAGPQFGDRDACALEVASIVLGHGEASRLATETRRRDRLVTDVNATCYMARQATTFLVNAQTTGELVESSGRALLDQVARLGHAVLERDELARAKAVLESDLVYRRETVQGQAHALGYYLSLAGSLDGERIYYEQLAGLDGADVRDACARYLRPDRCAASLVVPKSTVDSAGARRIRDGLRRHTRPARRSRSGAIRVDAHGIHCIDLEGGLRIRAHVDRSVAMAAGWLIWPGGLRIEAARDAGAASLMARLLTRGTRARDGDALAREIDGMAAVLDGFSGRNSLGVHFECLAEHVPTVVRRCLECATSPEFPERELEEERRVALLELEAEEDDIGRVAFWAMMERLYGKHPLGRRRRGTKGGLERMQRTRLRDLWERDYPVGRAVLAVAGDVDVEALVELVRTEIPRTDRRPGRDLATPGGPPKWPQRGRSRWIVRQREQAHIVLGFPGLTLHDRRVEQLEVLTTVLGGQSGRLFTALREREGLVYGVSASSVEAVDGGHVVVHGSTGQDKLDRARAAIDRELHRLCDEVVPADELERAKAWLVGQFEAGLQRRSRVASYLGFNEAYGLGYDAHLAYVDRVSRVTARQLGRLAREIFDPGRRVSAIVAARRGR